MARKLLIVLIGLALASFGLTVSASATRTVSGTYASPAIGAQGASLAGCAPEDGTGCVTLPGGPETYISVTIEDMTGGDVSASVTQDIDGDMFADEGIGGNFCTQTTAPFSITPGYDVSIFIYTGACDDGTPSTATSGTVTGTFTDDPSAPPPSPGGSPSPGGKLKSPGARLGFSNSTPRYGTSVTARASLKVCKGHAGTKIQLQRKVGAKFKKIAERKLSKTCKANFKVTANFQKAQFRSFWPKQDADHKAGKSKTRTVTTHR